MEYLRILLMNMQQNMNEDKQLPCTEKLVFDTEKQATGAAVAVGYQRGTKLKAYKCKHCGLWHLASHYQA